MRPSRFASALLVVSGLFATATASADPAAVASARGARPGVDSAAWPSKLKTLPADSAQPPTPAWAWARMTGLNPSRATRATYTWNDYWAARQARESHVAAAKH